MTDVQPTGEVFGLKETTKAYCLGSHRAVTPAETLSRYIHLLPAMGITRIANVTGLDRVGVPVVMVHRPNARSVAVQQGKGITLEDAKVSGMMEAIERFHGEYPILPVMLNAYEELRYTHNLIEPEALPGIRGSLFHRLLELPWVEGVDIQNDESIWLPLELVAYRPTVPAPPGFGCFRSETTGLAAGNNIIEATVHGLSEVIERDARTLWRFRSPEDRRDTRLDCETVDDPECVSVLDAIGRAGLAIAVWDVTSDIEIPTFVARLIERTEAARLSAVVAEGGGTHPTRRIALLRALTEALQSRLTMIAGSRDDLDYRHYRRSMSKPLAELRDDILHGATPRSFQDVPSRHNESFEADLSLLLDKLCMAGIGHVVVFDLTREELAIPVVRVVVPELEDAEDLSRYLPGRRLRKQIGTSNCLG